MSPSKSRSDQLILTYDNEGLELNDENFPFERAVSNDLNADTSQSLKNSGASRRANQDDFQMKFVLLAVETDRLIISNTNWMREVESWKEKYRQLESAKDLEIERLKHEIASRPLSGTLNESVFHKI